MTVCKTLDHGLCLGCVLRPRSPVPRSATFAVVATLQDRDKERLAVEQLQQHSFESAEGSGGAADVDVGALLERDTKMRQERKERCVCAAFQRNFRSDLCCHRWGVQ
jgi:hypothetical protein